ESSPRYGGRSWTARSPPTGPDHSRSRDGSWSGSACSAVGERQASVLSHPEKLSPKTTYVRPDGVVNGMPISVRSRSNFVVTPGPVKLPMRVQELPGTLHYAWAHGVTARS